MKFFLQAVAEAYHNRFAANANNLDDVCFVFPNKRSATFFTSYLFNLKGKALLAPPVLTISDLVEQLSQRVVDSRINLVFRLYRCYRNYLVSHNAQMEPFDKFRSWGETVLNDFDEVDKSVVDAPLIAQLFKNVKDIRGIRSNYLNEDQIEILEKYFGVSAYANTPEDHSLWIKMLSDDKLSADPAGKSQKDVRSSFLHLWEIMSELYGAFNEDLERDGLTTPGGAYRLAAKAMESMADAGEADASLLEHAKYVFVGFNVLSLAEFRIMKAFRNIPARFSAGVAQSLNPSLEKEPLADFFWDYSNPLFDGDASADSDQEPNPAAMAVRANAEVFPEPEWAAPFMEACRDFPDDQEAVKVTAVPSNAMQAKIMAEDLHSLMLDEGKEGSRFRKALKESKVAVVLPDEALLQPVLYSVPDEFADINLTMGIPMKLTAAVSFMRLLRRLYVRARKSDEAPGFYLADVKVLLGHPYMQRLFSPVAVRDFISFYSQKRKMLLFGEDFKRLAGKSYADGRYFRYAQSAVTKIFNLSLAKSQDCEASIKGMMDVLEVVRGMFEADLLRQESALDSSDDSDAEGAVAKSGLQYGIVDRYLQLLRSFLFSYREYKNIVDMNFSLASLMAERMISGQTVALEGEPLRGLQIMGVLETRSLDFDYLFIPSMNEKVMPRRARMRTFIPAFVRREFGMPPANYQEEIFAYYFYRLISRAGHVSLYYDSRVGDKSSGISRFLLQLKYLLGASRKSEFSEYNFSVSSFSVMSDSVPKKDYMDRIRRFVTPKGSGESKNLSASALIDYLECPLKFFYTKVLDINIDDEPEQAISDATFGTVIHGVFEALYLGMKPEDIKVSTPKDPEQVKNLLLAGSPISVAFLQNRCDDIVSIRRMLVRLINREHFKKRNDSELDDPLVGFPDILLNEYVELVQLMLRYEIARGEFRIRGCEFAGCDGSSVASVTIPPTSRYPDESLTVNIRYSIDRIDSVAEPDGERLRVIDYKTGDARLKADSLDDVFEACGYENKQIFQLLFYALILHHQVDNMPGLKGLLPLLDHGVRMEIYSPRKMNPEDTNRSIGFSTISLGNQQCLYDNVKAPGDASGATSLLDRFRELLYDKIHEIFDESVPFEKSPTCDCSFCNLKELCALSPQSKEY